jgi:cell division protein FtsN
MRITGILLIVVLSLASACSSTKTSLFGSDRDKKEDVKGTSIGRTLMPATPIKEVEEKLVPVENKAPSPQKYFVIIGSFRDPSNAKEHQSVVRKDGFVSEILKNDAGLYRVSVLATDNVTEARNRIRKIWAEFPQYSDTWLLIRKAE